MMTDNPYELPIHDEPLPITERSILVDMIYGAAIGLYYMFVVSAAIGVVRILFAGFFDWVGRIDE